MKFWEEHERETAEIAESTDEYERFVAKFQPKKTTDDCYTPAPVYNAIADWVAGNYGLDRAKFVRPFYPGGDYKRFDYFSGCVVVDNPPFSILAEILRFYSVHAVPFFLFAPTLTLFSRSLENFCCIPNGAERAAAERAAAERAAATKWQLSDREREIIRSLGKQKHRGEHPAQGKDKK